MFNTNAFFEGSPIKNPTKLTYDYAQVNTNLYIGNAQSIHDHKFLEDKKIKLIVNASNRSSNLTDLEIDTIQVIDIEDIVPSPKHTAEFILDIKKKANSVVDQMEKYISRGDNVLVHCHAGINRSALILGFYMILKQGVSPTDAINKIRKANATQRSIVALSNPLFESILKTLSVE